MFTETELTALNERFEKENPKAILKWGIETFRDKFAIVTSFQPTGIVTLHMLHELGAFPDVLTLDTGLLFQETYSLIDQVEKQFNLRLIRLRPVLTVSEQAQTYGDNLWARNPDQCCQIRKVAPLNKVLGNYEGWVTGLRRDQGESRRHTPVVGIDKRQNNIKIAPFVTWTDEMIWTYIHAHELPYNLLHDQNYPSIGCYPCTKPVVSDSDDPRAGRWSNHNKTECGIHTQQ